MENMEQRKPGEQGIEFEVLNTNLLDPDSLAAHLIKKYEFRDIQIEAEGNGEGDIEQVKADMKKEIREWISRAYSTLRKGGVNNEAIRVGVERFLEKHTGGTDLDDQFGASESGFVDALEESVFYKAIERDFGLATIVALAELLDKFAPSNVESDRLTELITLLEILEQYKDKFSDEELSSALLHVGERVNSKEHRAYAEMERVLKRVLKEMDIVEAGERIGRLQRIEKDLGWKVEA